MAKGYLYAVRMIVPDSPYNPVKVGFSIDPVRRLKQYFGSGPFPMEWIGGWPAENGVESEAEIHRIFAAFRLHGEWFFPHPDLLALIDQRLAKHPEDHARLTAQMTSRHVHQRNTHPLHKPKSDELIGDFLKRWEAAKEHVIKCPACNAAGRPELAAPVTATDLKEIRARVEAYVKSRWLVVLTAEMMAELLGVPLAQVKLWQKKGMVRYARISGGRFHDRSLEDALEILEGKAA